MTKKDYQQLAGVFGFLYRELRAQFPEDVPHGAPVLRTLDNGRRMLELSLQCDNPRFDAERFQAQIEQVAGNGLPIVGVK
ncbi:MAG TPA: hypothetical protein VH439_03975 [Gemmatimonadales bacterium]|jgi:hypothetical protein